MAKKMKRHMTHDEEFDIMKMVLDKFLWLGVIFMGIGVYKLIDLTNSITQGLAVLIVGAIVLVIFMIILVKEYNFMERK